MKRLVFTLGFLITCFTAFSHVGLDYPVGGENFHPGQIVTIQWHIIIPHDTQNWDLYFSDDGGANWQDLRLDIGLDTLTYNWTVPNDITDQGRIKVVMDNAGSNYEDESGDFSITEASGIATISGEIPIEFYPNPANDFIRIKSNGQTNYDEMQLLGTDGRLLQTIDITDNLFEKSGQRISLLGYAPGIYYLVASKEGKKTTAKIIKY